MTILSMPTLAVRPRFAAPRYASWQEAMKDAVRDVDELYRLLDFPGEIGKAAKEASQQFRLFAPRGFVARMRPGDPFDPLLRQVLPVGDEIADVPGYFTDPVSDKAAERQPGLLQKYRGRVLLITSGSCAIHCRYCFRRHFPYQDTPRSLVYWRQAIAEIAADTTVQEVILSGDDPLTLVDDMLFEFIASLAEISHLRRLRIHTRLPIVIPERVTDKLVDGLSGCRLTPIVVLHANHENELDETVATALAVLSGAGVVLLNQAVLLAGVNDSTEAQAALCERLLDLRVIPYYLHQLDRVAGGAHFEVPVALGRRIIHELRDRLPGYAVPRYVAEVPGAGSKTVLE
ncbi:MAG TPA: EF-P beta-lysylation protein EpmB [Lacipirellulaceae bacterium]|nr:EF-P beta-lysylation protein EpmB [Lacipirellulaceae bacterium]